MMRIIAALIFLCSWFACRQADKKVDKSLPAAKNDTFDFYGKEYDIPVIAGFAVDTIKQYDKTTDYTEELICPYIKDDVYKWVNGILKKEIKRKADSLYTIDPADKTPVDTSEEVLGVSEENILLGMYKNKNLVSYGFLSMSNEPNQMRPFRKYFTVNYDTALKRFIFFNDYFKITGHNDSALVRSIIYSKLGNPDFSNVSLDNDINFSFDGESVYFYFDMFGETGIPIGLVKQVKKRYLIPFINEAYK